VIQVDIGSHPPFPTGSKQFFDNFGNLIFLAMFNFWGQFEGLNDVFFMIGHLNHSQRLLLNPLNESPRQYFSNVLLCAINEDRMQKLRPREVNVLTCPNGAHMTFSASSPMVRFLDV
jgi:hypothetical protein